ncbi:hypothetical protein N9916_00920 [Akkermansiaceae bacterium]|nr:hypothetical protein [Akkermansiaceae bacterium]MDB4377477.1 hypothetical protein [Akkermansiaceae bacterium]MDB4615526.1 hypothetical protein [Akkermansiaceae bacterium]MDC0265053.1 hypothetical protein [bacterium]
MISQLGNEIIAHFGSATRGTLTDKNDNGIEVEALLLSLEVSGWDSSIRTAATNNDFELFGLDSKADRSTNVRDGFSFYRGVASTGLPGSLSFGQRRRIVVIDHTDPGNPLIRHNDLPTSSGALGAANVSLIREAINEATHPPAGLSFETWTTENSLTSGQDGATDDPDLDGSANLLEFSAGTNPLDRALVPSFTLEKAETGFTFSYERLIDATGITRSLLTGPLDAITAEFTPSEADIAVSPIDDDREKVAVTLPASFGPFIQLRVAEE